MAFTGNFMCTSFKQQLLEAQHNFLLSGGDTFKIALYTTDASFTAATTDYTATNEVGASGSYSAGGGTLTRINPTTSGTTAFTDFADITVNTIGKTAVPANVIGVSLVPINESTAILQWQRSTELDVLVGGKVLIRHSKATENASWGESQEIVAAAAGSQAVIGGTPHLLNLSSEGSHVYTAKLCALHTCVRPGRPSQKTKQKR